MNEVQQFISSNKRYSVHFTFIGTAIGVSMVALGIISYVGYLGFRVELLKPSDLNAGFLLSVGASILITIISPVLRADVDHYREEDAAFELHKELASEIESLRKGGKIDSIAREREEKLKGMLLSFLRNWQKWGFNVSRIMGWGIKQKGFTGLKNYEEREIKVALVSLVAEGKVRTRLSSKGATLYQIVL